MRTGRRRWDGWREGSHVVSVAAARGDVLPLARIEDARSVPTRVGGLVVRVWERLPVHYPGVALDAFVVLPDEVRGILVINRRSRPAPPPVPAVVGWFKSASSRAAGMYLWQRGFRSHHLRDNAEVTAVRRSISAAPLRWLEEAAQADEEVPPAA